MNERLSATAVQLKDVNTTLATLIEARTCELQASESQLHQAQKVECLGMLAGGIAHDFNNLLAVILLHCDSLIEDGVTQNEALVEAQGIKQTAQRAAALTRQLLTFSRKQILDPKVVNVNELLGELGKMLRRLIGEDVKLEVKTSPGLRSTRIDPNQFDQIVMNLAVNARDAMPQGGSLTFETENAELGEMGSCVLLRVSDSGSGMSAEVMAKIFEPFFTTKAPGRGTGLGLSTVIGIVKQSGGKIEVSSELGKGTQFKVYLPACDGEAPRTTTARGDPDELKGTEVILLVEDEPDLRELTASFLRESGYTVIEAKDGAQALSTSSSHEGVIDLIITDVLMPNMNGPEFVRRANLSRERPIKALFLSGYEAGDLRTSDVPEGGLQFLEKPYSRTALLTKLRALLDV